MFQLGLEVLEHLADLEIQWVLCLLEIQGSLVNHWVLHCPVYQAALHQKDLELRLALEVPEVLVLQENLLFR